MRAYVATGTLVFIVGCGGNVDYEPVSTHPDVVGAPPPDAAPPDPSPAAGKPDASPDSSPVASDGGADIEACWVDAPFFDAGAPGDTVYANPLHGDPAACGLPSICTMNPAPPGLCDHLCGPGAQDCYYTTQPLEVNCAVSTHRVLNEWDAGYPCVN